MPLVPVRVCLCLSCRSYLSSPFASIFSVSLHLLRWPRALLCSFTEEEDDLLYGDGDTKFLKAKSRLFAWLNRIHRMMLPVPPLDDLVDKLGGPNVRDVLRSLFAPSTYL